MKIVPSFLLAISGVVTLAHSPCVSGFVPVQTTAIYQSTTLRKRTSLAARRRNRSRDDDNDDGPKEIPQLPPIGATTLSSSTSTTAVAATTATTYKKLQLQYTCKVCDTRNCHFVSRIAYNNGVVIASCKGCQSQHLIADHLGFCNHKGGFEGDTINTIEDYFNNESNGDDPVVNRVSEEVFELEKMMGQYNMDSGAIIGEDGKLAME